MTIIQTDRQDRRQTDSRQAGSQTGQKADRQDRRQTDRIEGRQDRRQTDSR